MVRELRVLRYYILFITVFDNGMFANYKEILVGIFGVLLVWGNYRKTCFSLKLDFTLFKLFGHIFGIFQ